MDLQRTTAKTGCRPGYYAVFDHRLLPEAKDKRQAVHDILNTGYEAFLGECVRPKDRTGKLG